MTDNSDNDIAWYDCTSVGHFLGIDRFEGSERIVNEMDNSTIRARIFAYFKYCPACGVRVNRDSQ